jgi:hypothetical protein
MAQHGDGRQRTDGRPAQKAGPSGSEKSNRAPRRLVLLLDGEASEVWQVLAEYRGAEVSGGRLHADLQRFAAEHPGRCVAGEGLGPLGWTRFLWCRK